MHLAEILARTEDAGDGASGRPAGRRRPRRPACRRTSACPPSRSPRRPRWPTPSCAATWRTPPRTIRAKRAARRRRTGRLGGAAARPARRSRTDTLRPPGHATCSGWRPTSPARGGHGALGGRRGRGQRDRRRPGRGRTGADEVVKVKSMATQEIGLNEALAAARHRRAARPTWPSSSFSSATTGPRTSWSRPSTATGPRSGRSSCARWPDAAAGADRRPAGLAAAARAHLRQKFLSAKVGDLRRQLRGRRDRHPGRGRVRGQRPDVPDPAARR